MTAGTTDGKSASSASAAVRNPCSSVANRGSKDIAPAWLPLRPLPFPAMTPHAADLLPPRIAILDDENQIHASIRLRLGADCELVSFHDAPGALAAVGAGKFDLCLVDIHLPGMDGLAFIDAATKLDPALGFVVLSAFDTDENLRRAIPLQVREFIAKPLPDRAGFEAHLPAWVARTRERRRELALARHAGGISRDLQAAQLEREVELVAAGSARDALLETSNLLTTVHAHLVAACAALAPRAKTDASLGALLRNLEIGRKTAEAAATVAGGFFDSAYACRDTSPALVDPGLAHAVAIARRITHAEEASKSVDFAPMEASLPVRGLSGIDFLLMMVPLIAVALQRAQAGTTVGIRSESLARLDAAPKDPRRRDFLWANRRHALGSQAAVALTVTVSAPAFARAEAEAWLAGEASTSASATPRGLIAGLQKCHGLLGFALASHEEKFRAVVVLPV